MKIQLPENVSNIIQKLIEYGYEAYAVGGCVRDSIISRVPGDWDITTSATPMEVKKIFRRTIDTGIEHGTVTVMFGKEGYEVTTYRIDGEYEDGRHPESVEFTTSLREDLRRRDFTINAMAYNDETGLVDMFDGIGDIERKIIRCVGNPEERFSEDALRMLRAVRFSAQLGYVIEDGTAAAIRKLAGTIAKISKERIHTELNKILLSDNPDYVVKAKELGITDVVLQIMDKIQNVDVATSHMERLPKDISMRYGALFCQAGEDATRKMLKELKLDNNTIDTASKLVALHGLELAEDEVTVRRQASGIGESMYGLLLAFEQAYYEVSGDKRQEELTKSVRCIYDRILERKDPLTIKDLAVTGGDLIKAGMNPGKEMGETLKRMLEDVIEHPEHNEKEYLFANHLHI
jgi:tRNA nucleotidyltransferase (CCA-adding enzyme)